jgi:serine/threonine-protein kinase
MTGPPRDPFRIVGQVLDEQFRVDSVVGEGGFSVVYRGHHLGLTEPIAIKCMKLPGALGSAAVESFVQRFRDEGRILYKLSQGNLHIVRSIASGLTQAPATGALVPYTVLEWLDGYSLAEELEARRRAHLGGRSLQEIVPLLDSAVHAVAYAHTQGVVHRDLNPGNVFFAKTREGVRAKILDFGLAKVVSDHALALGPRAETLAHLQIFAPAYAAPEQMDKRIGPVGAWTDVYTLALVLLECWTDRAVISGEHLGEIMAKTLGLHRPTPRGLGLEASDEVEALFASALDLEPKARPADAGVFWGTLKHILAREGGSAAVLSSSPSALDGRMTPPVPTAPSPTGSVYPGAPPVIAEGARSSPHPWFPRLASTMPLTEDGNAEAARRDAMRRAVSARDRASEPAPSTVASGADAAPAPGKWARVAMIALALGVAFAGTYLIVRGLLNR